MTGRVRARLRALLLGVALLTLAGCGERREAPPPDSSATDERLLDFDTATVRLATARDTVALALELAVRDDQRQLGLMQRRHLGERAGMLFVYDSTQPPAAGFWMYRTLIPLDIAFLDSAGVVRAVRTMVPCATTLEQGCPSYEPGTPYRYALEVNAGALQRWGAATGDRLMLADLPRARPDTTRTPQARR